MTCVSVDFSTLYLYLINQKFYQLGWFEQSSSVTAFCHTAKNSNSEYTICDYNNLLLMSNFIVAAVTKI